MIASIIACLSFLANLFSNHSFAYSIIFWLNLVTSESSATFVSRELKLITPMGESPFMEVQNQFYQDLINDDFIEYKSGKFD